MNTKTALIRSAAALALLLAIGACGKTAEKDADDKVADELAGLPVAANDLLVTSYDNVATGDQLNPGAKGEIKLPGQTVSIRSLTTLKKAVDPNSGDEVRAAKGERFVVVDLAYATDDRYGYLRPAVQILVEDDGNRTNVFDNMDTMAPFLVSASDDAKLVLAVEGHDVTASLKTGERQADQATDILYREGIRQDLAKPLSFKTARAKVKGAPLSFDYTTTVESVQLTPYLPAELSGGVGKWAPEGNAYLIVTMSGDEARSSDSLFVVQKTVQTWTAKAGDETFKAITNPVFGDGDNQSAAIELPGRTTAVVLNVTAASIAEKYLGGNILDLKHGSQSLDVTFG